MSDDSGISRRRALAAGGTVAALALAGCTEEGADGEGSGSTPDAAQERLTPPDAPPVPDDQYWAFVVESLEYQNQALNTLMED